MALSHRIVGKAVFAASSFKQICSLIRGLLVLVHDEQWDHESCIEGLLFQMVAMLDHWALHPKVAKPPRSIVPFVAFDQFPDGPMKEMMYKMVAVPGAEAQIKKGRVLDSDEFMAALEAQIPAHLSGKPSPAA